MMIDKNSAAKAVSKYRVIVTNQKGGALELILCSQVNSAD